jgi:hypothetical protein
VALVPHRLAGLALALASLLVPVSVATAAPVTVDLRIEGPASTLFEGPVTTDVRPFQFTAGADTAPHVCDGTATNQGSSPAPVPTRGAALAAASLATPFSTSGTFVPSLGSPSFEQIAGQATTFDPVTSSFLAEYKNGVAATVGSCADPIATGDDVLFAYGTGAEPLLRLSGPATAATGAQVAVRVTEQVSGAPAAGATVGGQATGADGVARVGPFTQAGTVRLKATKAGAIRSNALVIAVGAATAQGVAGVAAGSVDRTAPRARLISPRNGHTYRRARFAPRLIRIATSERGSGVRSIKLRLTRRVGDRCWSYSGRRERFIGQRCGQGFFFRVSDRGDLEYLLPEKLARGHYVLDVVAIDNALNRDGVRERGRNRSVFDVR